MIHQVPTNCTNKNCPHHSVEGLPDFPGDDYVCTVHYECALGYGKQEACLLEMTPCNWDKILLWFKRRKKK